MGKNILEREEVIKKIKSQLHLCNDGKCHISRQGKFHLFHDKISKSNLSLAVVLLISSEIILLVITILVKDHYDPINNSLVFFAALPFAGFTIWYSRQLHKDQKQYSEFLQFKQTMNNNNANHEWSQVIVNGKMALEYEPIDVSILNVMGGAYLNLEEYGNALICFEQVRKLA